MAVEDELSPFSDPKIFSANSVVEAFADWEWLERMNRAEKKGDEVELLNGNQSALNYYARDVARYPLLSAEGEIIMFKLRDAGSGIQSLRESSAFKDSFEPKYASKVNNLLVG